jgi:hypothetical protein
MAIHAEKVELVKEALHEMVHIAEYGVKYKKSETNLWGKNATGGILGYPVAVILFSIIDCIGSVFSGDNNFKIKIDGNEKTITNATHHIYILNSKYFNCDLSQIDLENIYYHVRCTLTHNLLMPEGYILDIGYNEALPFKIAINELDNRIYIINLVPLFRMTKKAVESFIYDIDNGNINFESSKVHTNVIKKDVSTPMYNDPRLQGLSYIKTKKWIKK